jgi:hypothetical protein
MERTCLLHEATPRALIDCEFIGCFAGSSSLIFC